MANNYDPWNHTNVVLNFDNIKTRPIPIILVNLMVVFDTKICGNYHFFFVMLVDCGGCGSQSQHNHKTRQSHDHIRHTISQCHE